MGFALSPTHVLPGCSCRHGISAPVGCRQPQVCGDGHSKMLLRSRRVEKNSTFKFSTSRVAGFRRATASSPNPSDSWAGCGGHLSICRMSASQSYSKVKFAYIPRLLARAC
jgi:hypothetical protein